MTSTLASVDADPFVHHAFFYEGTDEYVAVVSRFITEGVRSGEAVLVAVPTPRFELLRERAPADLPDVQLIDMTALGRNPGRIIPLWQDFVTHNTEAGRAVRGVGEPVWAGRSAAELIECQWHEELLNLAFADSPTFPLMCPYDVAGLDPHVIDAARRSHPFVYRDGVLAATREFTGTPDASDDLDLPLGPPPASAEVLAFAAGQLTALRNMVYKRVVEADMAEDRAADVVIAVNEVATNSIRHGGGRGVFRLWVAGHTVVCEVRDDGRIGDALVGRRRSGPHADGGRGLWLVHQLCDLVEIRSGDGGTTVRMSIHLPAGR